MTLTRNVSDITTSDSKKRKRVVFANIDAGIEANECIKVFLVSCPEEMDTADCFSTNPVDLCHFFGEEGKIYGYNDLKINIWISCVSFHAYADVTFHSTFNVSITFSFAPFVPLQSPRVPQFLVPYIIEE
eukprot:TRINITY_DN3559_c1_g1_i1.p2 TRINITY_DN3559_c1_g1~~TRINITY_DN3559_c1_g1_i1.p2  ORF type:complete len:130 (+),score=8.99 TRINITY_DN3559_c1_g1_i1:246-635(+)